MACHRPCLPEQATRCSCGLGLSLGVGIGFVFSHPGGMHAPRMRKKQTDANAKAKAKAKAKATRKPIYIQPSRPKNGVRKKKLKQQSASQTIDLVMTIQTVQESSKSELSSRFLSTSKFCASSCFLQAFFARGCSDLLIDWSNSQCFAESNHARMQACAQAIAHPHACAPTSVHAHAHARSA